MIALMMMGAVAIYIAILFIALWLIPKVVQHKYTKRIIFIVWFLIPTWDVIIGYPIYKFLCATQAGVKIYKTVDNVEGFYVGEKRKEFEPIKPYEGYRYVDYKEMDFFKPTGKKYGTYWTGKYYRSYWIDNNTSELCVHYGERKFGAYADAYRSGKCIVKEEIAESEVSRWEYIEQSRKLQIFNVIDLRIDSTISIKDTKNNQLVSEVVRVIWKGGWLYGLLASIPVGNSWKVQYPRIVDIDFNQFIQQTLKTKKEEK